jgi:16S rRNA (adenine1518-N6/adenine1519-N6)-dimethyltransferase
MASRNRVNGSSRQTLAEVKSAARPRRPKLGQNFLADQSAAERIVAALGEITERTVLEIGPGKGALTDALVERAGRMIAIEIDRLLAAQLRMKYASRPNVEILEGDILSMDLELILRRRPGPLSLMEPPQAERARVVGNIPYYITSDILLRLFSFHHSIETIVIMVQKEVADRIAAKPGTREYGLLSATSQLYAKVEKLFTLPPGAFSPPPKVHSSVLRLTVTPRMEELAVAGDAFIDFLKLSFAQKRKTLANNLKARYPEDAVRAALKQAGVRSDARAESLPLQKAAAVFRNL